MCAHLLHLNHVISDSLSHKIDAMHGQVLLQRIDVFSLHSQLIQPEKPTCLCMQFMPVYYVVQVTGDFIHEWAAAVRHKPCAGTWR